MPRCTNCRSHVTVQFARVFGDNQDVVHGCMECLPHSELGEDADIEDDSQSGAWWRAPSDG